MISEDRQAKRRETRRQYGRQRRAAQRARLAARDAYAAKLEQVRDVFPSEEELAACSDADLEKFADAYNVLGRLFCDTAICDLPGRPKMGFMLIDLKRTAIRVLDGRAAARRTPAKGSVRGNVIPFPRKER